MAMTDARIGATTAVSNGGDALLSVIVPVYDEAATVIALLDRVAAAPLRKQAIVVDDGSRDATARLVERRINCEADAALIRHAANRGKGAAIRTGLAFATAEVVVIQDADLEYDPEDYPLLVEPILSGEADVVYGSRFLGGRNRAGSFPNRFCVSLLNASVRLLYGVKISDEATCYKAFRTDLLKRLDLRCERFEFCPEVTAKLCRLGIVIHEVPIRYTPRTKAEGKKIGWRDAVEAFATLLWWRFAPVRLLDDDELAAVKADAPRDEETALPEAAEVSA